MNCVERDDPPRWIKPCGSDAQLWHRKQRLRCTSFAEAQLIDRKKCLLAALLVRRPPCCHVCLRAALLQIDTQIRGQVGRERASPQALGCDVHRRCQVVGIKLDRAVDGGLAHAAFDGCDQVELRSRGVGDVRSQRDARERHIRARDGGDSRRHRAIGPRER